MSMARRRTQFLRPSQALSDPFWPCMHKKSVRFIDWSSRRGKTAQVESATSVFALPPMALSTTTKIRDLAKPP